MELGLSVGDSSKPFLSSKARDINANNNFHMELRLNSNEIREDEDQNRKRNRPETDSDPPLQLDLLPHRWSSGSSERGSSGNVGMPAAMARGFDFDVNRIPSATEQVSSPFSKSCSPQ